MNFGNPERPEVMWQFAESIRGMRDACLAFDTPVTGGNVSFYNESGDSAIWPTPVIGMLGLLEDYRLRVPTGFARAGSVDLRPGRDVRRARRVGVRRGRARRDLGPAAGARSGARAGAPRAAARGRGRATCWPRAHDCGDGGLAVDARRVRRSPAGTASPSPCRATCRRTSRSSASRRRGRSSRWRPSASSSWRSSRPPAACRARRSGRRAGPRVVFDGLFETTVRRAPRRLRGRDPAAPGRGRVIRAVTFDYWETLVSEGAGIDAEEDGTMRARQLRRWSEILMRRPACR